MTGQHVCEVPKNIEREILKGGGSKTEKTKKEILKAKITKIIYVFLYSTTNIQLLYSIFKYFSWTYNITSPGTRESDSNVGKIWVNIKS